MSSGFDILSLDCNMMLSDFIYEIEERDLSIKGIYNIKKGCAVLAKHMKSKKRIVVLADVDCDGMVSAYIVKQIADRSECGNSTVYTINAERKHGIQADMVEKLNKMGFDLLVIVDSSSNDIDIISKFKGDVVVIDHHHVDIDKNQLTGITDGGEYVIVTNAVADGEPDLDMSGCMVTYGVMKELVYNYDVLGERGIKLFNELSLEQCVAVTLYTDVIPLKNIRNQNFINTILNKQIKEQGLRELCRVLGIGFIDKSQINFKIAPLINSAVRCGSSREALDILLNRQKDVKELEKYKDKQREVIDEIMLNDKDTGDNKWITKYADFILVNITEKGLGKAYNGLLASKISSKYNKCTFVYRLDNGYYDGSFRGIDATVDYRAYFSGCGAVAKGHKGAFGLTIPEDKLEDYMGGLACLTGEGYTNFISYGNATGGIHHIEEIKEFKRNQNLIHLAHINTRSTGTEEINIIYAGPVELLVDEPRYKIYDVGGIECTAFEYIVTYKVNIYVEFTNEVRCYVSNME